MHAAIVTGVSRGLGEALAAAMLARGFAVLGVGRTASPRLKGRLYHHAECDLAQPALLAAALAINAAAPVVMADLFCRSFPDDGVERRIINISSGAAQTALAGTAVYGMSKAALEMLTRSIAVEHSASRLRCIAVRPGIFETGMQAHMRSRDPVEFPSAGLFRGFKENGLLKDPADVAARIVDRLVLGPVESGRTYTHTDL
jgi:NAD(P)-dependent dehydrogenase (short-subunit alcohol dehydrogenase family)